MSRQEPIQFHTGLFLLFPPEKLNARSWLDIERGATPRRTWGFMAKEASDLALLLLDPEKESLQTEDGYVEWSGDKVRFLTEDGGTELLTLSADEAYALACCLLHHVPDYQTE